MECITLILSDGGTMNATKAPWMDEMADEYESDALDELNEAAVLSIEAEEHRKRAAYLLRRAANLRGEDA